MALFEIVVLLAATIIAVPLAKRLGLGSVLGYLLAGVVIGPRVGGVIADTDTVTHISEFGVVLLLFVIGLELKPARLWVMRKLVFGLGAVQVIVTTLLLGAAAFAMGLPLAAAATVGFGLSLSSTAFVLPMLGERKELGTGHGQGAFAILLFQDLAVIPLLALLPALAGRAAAAGDGIDLKEAATIVGAIAAVLIGGRYLTRPLLRIIANSGYREVFTAATLLIVIAAAGLLAMAGLSPSMGAFLAGVLLADSEYRHELEADIEPFKGLFLGLFFMGVGMTANLSLLLDRAVIVVALVAGLILAKSIAIYFVARLWRFEPRSARKLGLALAQAGEFGFVLWALAATLKLIDGGTADLLVLVVTLSMAATPLVFLIEEKLLSPWLDRTEQKPFDKIEIDYNPILIAGFGRMGNLVGRLLRAQRIPFTALDINPEQVALVRRFGSKPHYGDASRLDLLTAAGAADALVLILAIDDVEATMRTVETCKKHFPKLRIVARARDRQHAIALMQAGVDPDDVIRETFGSAIMMAEKAMDGIGTPEDRTRRAIEIFRNHDIGSLHRTYELVGNEAQLIQTAQQAAAELEELFAADARNANDDEPATKRGT